VISMFFGLLDREAQSALVDDLRAVVTVAPFITPVTPSGRKMSVRMTSAGAVGWVTDQSGYRYDPVHPNGSAWPPIPERVLKIWRDVSGVICDPDCCLINYYSEAARMGMHQDKDEASFELFRMGNTTRGGNTQSVWLDSGDVVVMGGAARMCYHGIDKIRFGSSTLLNQGGRINLTMRVAC